MTSDVAATGLSACIRDTSSKFEVPSLTNNDNQEDITAVALVQWIDCSFPKQRLCFGEPMILTLKCVPCTVKGQASAYNVLVLRNRVAGQI